MTLEVHQDFINRMTKELYIEFCAIQSALHDAEQLILGVVDNEYRQYALDALGLCILSVAEAMTE